MSTPYRPKPIFTELGDGFGDAVRAADFPMTKLRYRNDRAAASIGLDRLSEEAWISHFGRFEPLADNLPEPLAQRYHGHQFRHYNPDIGDGRGFLFAQMLDDRDRVMDLGTKGSGITPYSRSGDGRLTLKGAFREILASEMLEAIGINTSKTFSVIETGEQLVRGDEPSPTRSAVMVRLTHGHIRIGTFQRHAYYSDADKLDKLTRYALRHYFGEEPAIDGAEAASQLLDHVATATAQNAADLMIAGYVHGVLNSDNINITGEIFDFGPFRFLTEMDLGHIAAYFDERGLYRYGRQPEAVHWDLYQLGGALTLLAPEQAIRDILEDWPIRFDAAMRRGFIRRLGVTSRGNEEDAELLHHGQRFLVENRFPYERFFFDAFGANIDRMKASPEAPRYSADADLLPLLARYEPDRRVDLSHRYFAGEPCTMAIEEVEALWAPIAERDDWSPFYQKLEAIADMRAALALP